MNLIVLVLLACCYLAVIVCFMVGSVASSPAIENDSSASKYLLTKKEQQKIAKHLARVPSATEIRQIAAQHHQQAISLAQQGQYEESLPYFRSAVRKMPSMATYWNDLGVTELRLGLYTRSLKRFLRTLQLDPSFAYAQDNIEEIRKYIKSEEFDTVFEHFDTIYEQEHVLLPMPEINAEELLSLLPESDKFANIFNDENSKQNQAVERIRNIYSKYLSTPFVIRNALPTWHYKGIPPSEFIEYLHARFGNHRVDFYPHNMKEEDVHPMFSTLSRSLAAVLNEQTLDEVFNGVDASESGTYVQWNMAPDQFADVLLKSNISLPFILDDMFWQTKCFDSMKVSSEFHHKTHWKMLLIGNEGSGMFNHKDYLESSSYQLQLVGRKKWHLCPPNEDTNLYFPGQVDMFSPDYKRFPKAKNIRCYQIILRPGDVIYYPREHWHQTRNLDTPTISITGTLVTHESFGSVIQQLQSECGGKRRIFVPEDETQYPNGMCSQLKKKCFPLWKKLFSPTVERFYSSAIFSNNDTMMQGNSFMKDRSWRCGKRSPALPTPPSAASAKSTMSVATSRVPSLALKTASTTQDISQSSAICAVDIESPLGPEWVQVYQQSYWDVTFTSSK